MFAKVDVLEERHAMPTAKYSIIIEIDQNSESKSIVVVASSGRRQAIVARGASESPWICQELISLRMT